MSRSFKLAAVLGVTVALAACGGSDGVVRADELDESSWTLTILSPADGELVSMDAVVEVEVVGEDGEPVEEPTFEIGVFADGELVARSAEPVMAAELPLGQVALSVEGIDEEGRPLANVQGDAVEVRVVEVQEPDFRELGVPGIQPDELFDREEIIPNRNLDPRERQEFDEFERRLP